MRTLKTFVIALSLFLFSMPATAANYPPEMPDIQNAPIQFVCEAPSSVFLKMYLDLNKKWRVLITGRNQQEMLMEIISQNQKSVFAFIPSTEEWKNVRDLSEKEEKEIEKYIGGNSTREDDLAIHSCVKSNLRSRGLLQ